MAAGCVASGGGRGARAAGRDARRPRLVPAPRWARRRPPWARRHGPWDQLASRVELPPDEEPIVPLFEDTFAFLEEIPPSGAVGFDDWDSIQLLLLAIGLSLALFTAAVAWLGQHVLPWLGPFVAAYALPILGVAAALAVLVLLDRLQRPWYVELRRQGLGDAPRRAWRVRGWWRSRRLLRELAAAVREGRTDSQHAVILFSGRNRGPAR